MHRSEPRQREQLPGHRRAVGGEGRIVRGAASGPPLRREISLVSLVKRPWERPGSGGPSSLAGLRTFLERTTGFEPASSCCLDGASTVPFAIDSNQREGVRTDDASRPDRWSRWSARVLAPVHPVGLVPGPSPNPFSRDVAMFRRGVHGHQLDELIQGGDGR